MGSHSVTCHPRQVNAPPEPLTARQLAAGKDEKGENGKERKQKKKRESVRVDG